MTVRFPWRSVAWIAGVAALLIALAILFAAAFPVGWFRESAKRHLSARFGTPVRIGGLERENGFSLAPIIRVTGLHVPQARWAGQGELASVRELRVRVALVPLLIGQVRSTILSASGVRLDLVRAADGRENWRGPGAPSGHGEGEDMAIVRITDMRLHYRDAKQERAFQIAVSVDPSRGLVAQGSGEVDGAPVRVRAVGAAMRPGSWPFTADMVGTLLSIHVRGRMDGPMRTDAMRFHITAHADDLKRIDRVIEAGLFGTRAVNIAADVDHHDRTWTVRPLSGTIGQSIVRGHVTARKIGERNRIDGDVHFARLDFDDLANAAGAAKAKALEQAEGLRLVPNTRIDIVKMRHTDGRLAVRADHIVDGRRPSALANASAVLTLDHLKLDIDQLRIGLDRGVLTGHAIVDRRDDRPKPLVTMALDLNNSSIAALAGGGTEIDAPVEGRARLTGAGSTIREAVGTSNGTIDVIARAGHLPKKVAVLLGFDIGRGLFGDNDGAARINCGIVRLTMKGGVGTFSPLLVDTSLSQSRGTGTIRFPDEAINATVVGAPKEDALLRLPGTLTLAGTIRAPRVELPPDTKTVGTFFKAIGRAISGDNPPPAGNANCPALIRQTLGRP